MKSGERMLSMLYPPIFVIPCTCGLTKRQDQMGKILFPLFLFAALLTGRPGMAQKTVRFQPKPALIRLIDGNLKQAVNQYKILMGRVPAGRLPKTYYSATDKLETSDAGWWTSGFYPGTLWYLYEFSHDSSLLREASQRLRLLEKEQYNRGTHDLGFMMYCSFGNALRLGVPSFPAFFDGNHLDSNHLDSNHLDSILLHSARSLSTRFNPTVGCIRSWDSKPWKYPVIIDNMMNLELLFWATHISNDSSFYRIAVTHANTTMHNHFRPDYSSFHVVDYDTATGEVLGKKTAQGYSDSSAWARGQAWGLYGYTVMYRSTHDPKYLEQAEHIAHFILANPHLPADKIPYWDFNAPDIPRALRDASAAAVIASALIELSRYAAPATGGEYLDVAEQIIVNLSSNTYKAVVGSNGGFLLRHSVGHFPAKSEVDVPLTYADYYFVEAMLRYKELGSVLGKRTPGTDW
jgi:unsaturated chondroitin disaccharide hydrolase